MEFIKFKPQEFKERAEWLFWSLLIQTKESLEQLRDIFSFDSYKWAFLKKQVLFEILLWEFAESVTILKAKLLSQEQIDDLILKIVFYMEILFPDYKNDQIIDIFSGYLIYANGQEYEKMRKDLKDQLIYRLCWLFNTNEKDYKTDDITNLLFMKFPWGWALGLDGFSAVKLNQIRRGNIQAKQIFNKEIIIGVEKFKAGGTEEEIQERKKREENDTEFYNIVEDISESLEEEIKHRNYIDKS
jgi:hypothetical protein